MKKRSFLKDKAHQLRTDMFEMCVNAGHGHISSGFSCTDMLTSLYYGGHLKHNPNNPEWEERDRFFLSKGHSAIILYTILADRGYFPKEQLKDFLHVKDKIQTEFALDNRHITVSLEDNTQRQIDVNSYAIAFGEQMLQQRETMIFNNLYSFKDTD